LGPKGQRPERNPARSPQAGPGLSDGRHSRVPTARNTGWRAHASTAIPAVSLVRSPGLWFARCYLLALGGVSDRGQAP